MSNKIEENIITNFPDIAKFVSLEARDTLKYFYYIIRKGAYIRDGKFYLFNNQRFVNNWSNGIVSEIELGHYDHKNKRYWTASDCLIGVDKHIVSVPIAYYPMKDMLDEYMKLRKYKGEYFLNTLDFAVVKKDGTEPFPHIWGNKKKLDRKYKFIKVVSSCVRGDLYADCMIPTNDCWKLISKKKFPPDYKNDFILGKPVAWNNRIECAIFRGSSTGCTVDFTNPRLLFAKISQDWRGTERDGWIDVGITRQIKKAKLIDRKFVRRVNLENIGIELSPPITMKDQMKYKYIFDIEGNAAAYRIGGLLAMRSVILRVESEYKLWIDQWLHPMEHYIPIKRDGSNLAEIIKWCHEHDDACKKIADNAYSVYKKMYNREAVFNYLDNIL